jgi:hypothetical protein
MQSLSIDESKTESLRESPAGYILDSSGTELLASTGSLAARPLAAKVTPGKPIALLAFRNEVSCVF